MTDAELEELLSDCPTLYHMAAAGSWPLIRTHGLLSTTALLDLCGVTGTARDAIESTRRPENVTIPFATKERVVIRDNKPMDDRGLDRCLLDGLTPTDWYRLLNARVFFWLTKERLLRLLSAGAYANSEHDVLELDSRALVSKWREAITLSPINSGCTKPYPHPRGLATFQSIAEYPYAHWRARRKRGERVVELAVSNGVVPVRPFVRRVVRMRKDIELTQLKL
ncbi:MAG: hypothetical protein BroJett013_25940 [Alphaproteobacteria bacterium]|nr:MAG: hypothetical protein BroJett013_25940 [Alphaproteobacteria bacterium]